jgi:uncharacterized protein (DUF1697 family)
MASVVFMRGVNVGGHQVFRPAELAKKLARLEVVNIGAAGTFVVHATIRHGELREELRRHLSFAAEFMITRASEVQKLVAMDPFRRSLAAAEVRCSVSVLAKRPRSVPKLPLSQPAGEGWQVRIVGLQDRFALVLWRRAGKPMIYPNEVVEKNFGVAATTRTWETILKVHRALQRP